MIVVVSIIMKLMMQERHGMTCDDSVGIPIVFGIVFVTEFELKFNKINVLIWSIELGMEPFNW